ncbi:MAG TPA: co-chaperone GroES [Candidatus Saccharimonadales bacterium]|nr:co-chaperone GroES [Candidatus Saccharimonadales bacterium]
MAKVSIKPLAGYALVEPEEAMEKTASGIYLPDNAQERPARGKVVAVGDSVKHPQHVEEAQFKVGDSVIYKKWGGDEIKLDNIEYKLVKFEDVMAIVN